MIKKMSVYRNLMYFGIPLLLFGILILIMKSSLSIGNNALSIGITVDLLILIPLTYYLLIRKSEIPSTTVIPVMIVGVLIGSYFMPIESQTYLSIFKAWALPIIEISIFTLVIFKIRSAYREYKKLKASSPDFFNTLKNVCSEILPKKLVAPFATEVAVFYYGFFHWRTLKLTDNQFTYHKNSGTPALFGAFIMIIIIETVALHFLLTRWSTLAAWILTLLSAYTAVQIFGFAKSLSKRPSSINEEKLTLKYGILNETEIPLVNIKEVKLSKIPIAKTDQSIFLSPLGTLESHNVVIHLKCENKIVGLYGKVKNFETIALHLDDPKRFKSQIEMKIEKL